MTRMASVSSVRPSHSLGPRFHICVVAKQQEQGFPSKFTHFRIKSSKSTFIFKVMSFLILYFISQIESQIFDVHIFKKLHFFLFFSADTAKVHGKNNRKLGKFRQRFPWLPHDSVVELQSDNLTLKQDGR